MSLPKTGSYEWRKALPKTSSFDNVDFMSATMSEGGVKGAADIKAALEALKGATGDDAVDKAEKLAQLVNTAGVRAFCECGVVEGHSCQAVTNVGSEHQVASSPYLAHCVRDMDTRSP